MIRFLLKRVTSSILILSMLFLLVFLLGQAIPGDPIEQSLGESWEQNDEIFQVKYKSRAAVLGYDMPGFYFSIIPSYFPDSLNQIYPLSKRKWYRALLFTYNDNASITTYVNSVVHTSYNGDPISRRVAGSLLGVSDPKKIQEILSTDLPESAASLQISARNMIANRSWIKNFFPSIRWNRSNNRFHKSLKELFSGGGYSHIDGQKVGNRISKALSWSVIINFVTALLAYLVAIFLGIYLAFRNGQKIDKILSNLAFIFYAIPVFWLATIGITFLTKGNLGIGLFPGLKIDLLMGGGYFWNIPIHQWPYFILPILCMALPVIAYLSKQMKSSILTEKNKLYAISLQSQGISSTRFYRKQLVKNALFPIITQLAAIFPALITGSLIIEVLFNIPGMGRLLYDSILANDWPIVFPIVLLAGLFTIIGYFISDLLYIRIDPRIKPEEM